MTTYDFAHLTGDQWMRGEMPSLASFLSQKGYTTLAMHPFQSWFWNRGNVYEAFGFDCHEGHGEGPLAIYYEKDL